MMAELKTRPTGVSVTAFVNGIQDETRRRDCRTLLALMGRVTGTKPRMWGETIVGFGTYHYKYASGREGDWFLAGFSPRKHDLTVYLMCGVDAVEPLLEQLGRYRIGKSCLYMKRLADVRLPVLRRLVAASVGKTRQAHGARRGGEV